MCKTQRRVRLQGTNRQEALLHDTAFRKDSSRRLQTAEFDFKTKLNVILFGYFDPSNTYCVQQSNNNTVDVTSDSVIKIGSHVFGMRSSHKN